MGSKKNFVLDTNVILHDYNCLKNFQENDIYLPIVVLEELDKFKKGNEQINYNAREFVRELDLLTDDSLFTKGVKLGEGLGRLFVVTGNVEAPKVQESFPVRKPDHLILAVAEYLTAKNPKMKTILVTKDVNLRMKARSIGILCEDYITDKVLNTDVFEKSNETYENIEPTLIDKLYSSREGLDVDEFDFKQLLHPNVSACGEAGDEEQKLRDRAAQRGAELCLGGAERPGCQAGGVDRKSRNRENAFGIGRRAFQHEQLQADFAGTASGGLVEQGYRLPAR